MLSKSQRLALRRFHRWSGLVIGLQLFLWIGSGTYFAWFPIEIIKGEDQKVEIAPKGLKLSEYISPEVIQLPEGLQVKSMSLQSSLVGVIYWIETMDDKRFIFDAKTGDILPMLDTKGIEILAKSQTKSNATVVEVSLVSEAKDDYRGKVPAYKVALDDFRRTRLYLDPWTGKVLASRNAFWRIYDFFWMLHIMDFQERENFNNWLLRIVSTAALLFVVSGYLLFFNGKPPKRKKHRDQLDASDQDVTLSRFK